LDLGEEDAVAFSIDKNLLTRAGSAEYATVARFDAGVTFPLVDDLMFVHPFPRRDFEDL